MSQEILIQPRLAVVKFVTDADIKHTYILTKRKRALTALKSDRVADDTGIRDEEHIQTENWSNSRTSTVRKTRKSTESLNVRRSRRASVLPSIAEQSSPLRSVIEEKPTRRVRKSSLSDVVAAKRRKLSVAIDSISDNCISTTAMTPESSESLAWTPSTPKSSKRSSARSGSETPKPKSARKLFTVIRNDREPTTPKVTRKKDLKQVRDEYDEYDDFEDDFDEISDEYSLSESGKEIENESQSDGETNRLSPIVEYATDKPIRNEFHYNVHLNEYFSSKSHASNNRISSIETPRLQEEEMKDLLANSYCKHKREMNVLLIQYEKQFVKWMYFLKEGFNLVMYGLGSKIDLLRSFRSKMLRNYHVLSIHGYFPGLTIRDILNSLVVDILKQDKCPRDVNEALSLIKECVKTKTVPIFILVNNIDGVVLRENKYQELFAKLATMQNIHLIASIDHVNALTLWGNAKLSQFNFLWLEVTTFRPYIKEVSFEDPLRLNDADSDFVSLSSLREIFKHLPAKTKKIFRILATEQLANKSNKQYKGISYTLWYKQAKDSFLVSGRNAFRVMLTELIDHDVIRLQNEDAIMLRLRANDLEKFYEQQFEDEV